jgi:hypothetical protein
MPPYVVSFVFLILAVVGKLDWCIPVGVNVLEFAVLLVEEYLR